LIVVVGEAGGFLVNGLSFVDVIVCLAAMRIPKRKRPPVSTPVWVGLREGWLYVRGPGPIRAVLGVVAAVSLFGLPYGLLLPRYTHTVFGGTAKEYALLMTAPGVGALLAGIFIIARGMRGITRRIAVSPIIAGVSLAAVAWTNNIIIASILLVGVGFGFLLILNSANMLLQTIAEPEMRGRVLSYYTIAFIGVAPIGNLLIPGAAEYFGIPAALQASGAACCFASGLFALGLPSYRAEIRRRLAADPKTHPPTAPADSQVSMSAVIPAVK
jgi:hypothetical protein